MTISNARRAPEGRQALLPASGAWHPELGAADRQFFELSPDRPFALEGGGRLTGATLAYETWGTLDSSATNAVLVCHALTGDAHAHGPPNPPAQQTPGWWNDFIGPARPLDTDRYFVVCANVLGGCGGTTGPSSVNPATGERYGPDFPVVTIRDMVRSQALLARHLGVERWLSVVGGSMGGMQALEWAVTFPRRLRSVVVVASAAAASPQQIAWSNVGRNAIYDDPAFAGGRYYDTPDGGGPHRGLANARRIAMIHYRSADEFDRRFGRASSELALPVRFDQRFDVERYLDYNGKKLVRRFDANTYIALNKAMDLHDIGAKRSGGRRFPVREPSEGRHHRASVAAALRRVLVPTLVMSVSTDFLYPRSQQLQIVDALRGRVPVCHVDIDSDNGHDGFLTEPAQTGSPMGAFIDRVAKHDEVSELYLGDLVRSGHGA